MKSYITYHILYTMSAKYSIVLKNVQV